MRFGDALWDIIEDESERDGVSAAQWIRDSALARALWEHQRRGDSAGLDALALVRQEHRAEDERQAKAVRDILASETAITALHHLIAQVPDDTASWIRERYGV